MFGIKKKLDKHNWRPLEQPLLTKRMNDDGKLELFIYVVEHCKKTGMYRYVRVPSNKQLDIMEGKIE